MLTKVMERDMVRYCTYRTINESPWFQEIVKEASENSERSGNRIKVHFATAEAHSRAVEVCKRRNISFVNGLHTNWDGTKDYTLDIFMNWKECRPSRANTRKPVILD